MATILIVLPDLLGPTFRRRRVTPRGRDSALQDMPLVSLLDDAEGDVSEQGRKDTALRRASVAAHEVTFGEDACLEECNDQAVHFRVIVTPANSRMNSNNIDTLFIALVLMPTGIGGWNLKLRI